MLKNTLHELNFHIQIHYGQNGIQSVSLNPSLKNGLQWTFSSNKCDRHLETMVNMWLKAYCQKKSYSIRLPFDWTCVPQFTQRVLEAVGTIPFGSLSSYGQIAYLLDRPQAARAVGGACRRNPFILFIPCHRVLDAKQALRGYSAGGILVKQQLLIYEESRS